MNRKDIEQRSCPLNIKRGGELDRKIMNNINSNVNVENERKAMSNKEAVTTLAQVQDDIFYRVADLQAILERLHVNYSIYTIRDYETWKCLNYKCAKRHNEEVAQCIKCGGQVRAPLIPSPRTKGGGRGAGHRRYTGAEIKEIVKVFTQRN